MILKGNRRGGSMQLALHLLNADDNEHVTIHQLRGFISDDLKEALMESYAISRGTRCKKFLYSLSLSPPEFEKVSVETFEKAITEIEKKLGFEGQPRAIVFHEKEGRRHAHCVWSRIDAHEMKAIDPSYDKLQLRDMSREIYLEHGWKMPRGLMNSQESNPLNFSLAELQQAKRQGQDPRTIKATIQECWAVSDSRKAFESALKERGYYLAKGDRRGFVLVDWHGEVYSVAKMAGVRTKEVRARLGEYDDLPSVDDTKAMLSDRFTERLKDFSDQVTAKHDHDMAYMKDRKKALTILHRHDREALAQSQEQRHIEEIKARSARLPTGLKALWFRLTGKYKAILKQNEQETKAAKTRAQQEQQSLIDRQLAERRRLQQEVKIMRARHVLDIKKLNRDMARLMAFEQPEQSKVLTQRLRQRTQRQQRHEPDMT